MSDTLQLVVLVFDTLQLVVLVSDTLQLVAVSRQAQVKGPEFKLLKISGWEGRFTPRSNHITVQPSVHNSTSENFRLGRVA